MPVDDASRFGLARATLLGGLVAIALLAAGWRGVGSPADGVTADGATLAPLGGSGAWVVTSLRTGGIAARSGLHVGDVIDGIGGHPPGIGDGPVLLHVAARGDVGAHSLILRPAEVASREDPDRRGR